MLGFLNFLLFIYFESFIYLFCFIYFALFVYSFNLNLKPQSDRLHGPKIFLCIPRSETERDAGRTQTHLCVAGLALAAHSRAGWRSAGAGSTLRASTTADRTRWPRRPVQPTTRIYKSNCTWRKQRFGKHYEKGHIRHTDSPVQLWVLHTFCCRPEPVHSLPPLWGAGLSHWRVRALTPPPQWAEQSVQWPHWLQLPSTEHPGTESHCSTPASHVLEDHRHTQTITDLSVPVTWLH